MKVIIEQDGVKRQIEGPFWMCVSNRDAQHIIDALQKLLNEGIAYGWLPITELPPPSMSSTSPQGWKV